MYMGERVKKERERAGLSQPALAERAGLSKDQIQRLETNIDASTNRLIKVADALGVNFLHFLYEHVAPDDPDMISFAPVVTLAGVKELMTGAGKLLKDLEKMPVDGARRHLFAVEVPDNAMDKRGGIAGGRVVIDCDETNLRDRYSYAVVVDGEVMIRTYRDTDGPPRLEAESRTETHPTIFLDGLPRVFGRVEHYTVSGHPPG